MSLIDDIKKHEGFKAKPYRCTEGYLTVAYGKRVDYIEVSKQTAEEWLKKDLEDLEARVEATFGWYYNSPQTVKDVVMNMCYQLGVSGFSKFKKTIDLLDKGKYDKASKEMLNSLWSRQTPQRSKELSDKIKQLGEK